MPDATRVLPPGMRFLDASANVLAGGSLEFYQAAGSTPRTVYSDSALSVSLGVIVYLDSGGYPVTSQGGSTKTLVYTGVNAYKIIAKDSGGSTVWTHDNIIGALDTSSFSAVSALPKTPVSVKSSDYTVVDGDRGKVISCNPSSTFTITLPNAITVGDNWLVIIRHRAAANAVKIVSVASQTISGPIGDASPTAIVLTGRGESVWLVSDGANWIVSSYVPPLMRPNGLGAIVIKDRVSAAPSSDPGARYIVTAAFSTFEQYDIIEDDGQGSFFEYTPATDCGWVAYVQDEDIYYYFRGSAWVSESATETQQGTIELATGAETKAGTDATRAVTPVNLQAQSWIRVTKTADESLTTTTTVQDDNHLLFAVAATTKYSFRAKLLLTTPAAADFKYTFTGPAAPTLIFFGSIAEPNVAGTGQSDSNVTVSGFTTEISMTSTGTLWIVTIDGILHNGANAGTVTLQWAQVAASGTTTVYAGSYLEYIVVG